MPALAPASAPSSPSMAMPACSSADRCTRAPSARSHPAARKTAPTAVRCSQRGLGGPPGGSRALPEAGPNYAENAGGWEAAASITTVRPPSFAKDPGVHAWVRSCMNAWRGQLTHEVLGQRVTMLNFRRLLRRSYSLWELGSGTSSYPCYRYSPPWHPQSFITLLRGWRPKTGPGWVTFCLVRREGGSGSPDAPIVV